MPFEALPALEEARDLIDFLDDELEEAWMEAEDLEDLAYALMEELEDSKDALIDVRSQLLEEENYTKELTEELDDAKEDIKYQADRMRSIADELSPKKSLW